MDNHNFDHFLINQRQKLNLSLDDISKQTTLPIDIIKRYETQPGKIPLKIMGKMLKAYQISMLEFTEELLKITVVD